QRQRRQQDDEAVVQAPVDDGANHESTVLSSALRDEAAGSQPAWSAGRSPTVSDCASTSEAKAPRALSTWGGEARQILSEGDWGRPAQLNTGGAQDALSERTG